MLASHSLPASTAAVTFTVVAPSDSVKLVLFGVSVTLVTTSVSHISGGCSKLVIPLHSGGITPEKPLRNKVTMPRLLMLPNSFGSVPLSPGCVTVLTSVTGSVVARLLPCSIR